MAQYTLVTQVQQLKPRRDGAVEAPPGQPVEAHLEHRLVLEPLAWCTPGFIVDDSNSSIRCAIDPIDVTANLETGLERHLDGALARLRLETLRVLKLEVCVEERSQYGGTSVRTCDGSRSCRVARGQRGEGLVAEIHG